MIPLLLLLTISPCQAPLKPPPRVMETRHSWTSASDGWSVLMENGRPRGLYRSGSYFDLAAFEARRPPIDPPDGQWVREDERRDERDERQPAPQPRQPPKIQPPQEERRPFKMEPWPGYTEPEMPRYIQRSYARTVPYAQRPLYVPRRCP